MAAELVSFREAARRLGVSDVALHKARAAGRITAQPGDEDPKTGHARLRWPDVREQYLRNTDGTRRTHVGSQGTDPRRAKDSAPVAAVGETPPPAVAPGPTPDPAEAAEAAAAMRGPSITQSKAVREAYLARMAKLEYERAVGKVVNADEVRAWAFKAARTARNTLMTLPDKLAPVLASCTDVGEVQRLLADEIERTCAKLARDAVLE